MGDAVDGAVVEETKALTPAAPAPRCKSLKPAGISMEEVRARAGRECLMLSARSDLGSSLQPSHTFAPLCLRGTPVEVAAARCVYVGAGVPR